MTFWVKLLTVVVFILSLIFASMSIVLFGKREDYRYKFVQEAALHAQEKQQWTQDNAKLHEQLTQAGTEIAEANANVNAIKVSLSTANDLVKSKEADLREKDIQSQKDKDLNLKIAYDLDKFTADLRSANADREKLTTENKSLYVKFSDAESRSNKLEKENTDLTASLTTATAALDKAKDTLKLNDEIFAELSRRNVAWRELITKWATLPDIKTKVLSVDKESNIVLLNAGLKQGVQKNFEFSIFRDGTFVAKVNVIDVQDNLCAARITVPKLPIQKGDNAWTRLMSD